MHACVTACVCNGGSPVSCLQPRVHSQQSVCGEYDGKVHAFCLQAHLGNQNSVMYYGFICVRSPVCVFNCGKCPPLCVCVCVCCIFVYCFFSSRQHGLKRKAFLKSGCVRQQQSLTISLSNTSFICVNSQCPPSSKTLWLLCYVTSASLLDAQQSICSVIAKDGCMFMTFFPPLCHVNSVSQ